MIGGIGRGPDPGAGRNARVGELVADGGDGLGGAGRDGEVGVGEVVETLDAVGGWGFGICDGGVAGVAGWIGYGLSGGSAGVVHGWGGGGIFDCGVDA